MRARVELTNSSSDPIRIGSGSTIEVIPANQQPRNVVISARDGGAEHGDVIPGSETTCLQCGADAAGLVVQLSPRHVHRHAVRHHGGADEVHTGRRRVRRPLQPLDRGDPRTRLHTSPRYSRPALPRPRLALTPPSSTSDGTTVRWRTRPASTSPTPVKLQGVHS